MGLAVGIGLVSALGLDWIATDPQALVSKSKNMVRVKVFFLPHIF